MKSASVGPVAASSADRRSGLALARSSRECPRDVRQEERHEDSSGHGASSNARTAGTENVVHTAWPRLHEDCISDATKQREGRGEVQDSAHHSPILAPLERTDG